MADKKPLYYGSSGSSYGSSPMYYGSGKGPAYSGSDSMCDTSAVPRPMCRYAVSMTTSHR